MDVEQILINDQLGECMKGKKYQFYTKKRLDNLLEDMIDSFSHDYLGEDYAWTPWSRNYSSWS